MHIVDASCKFVSRTWELSAVAYEKISVWLSLCMFYSFLFSFCCWNTVTSGQPLKSTHTQNNSNLGTIECSVSNKCSLCENRNIQRGVDPTLCKLCLRPLWSHCFPFHLNCQSTKMNVQVQRHYYFHYVYYVFFRKSA